MTTPDRVVYGPIATMITEYAAFDPRQIGVPVNQCRYIVLPLGSDEWDGEWFATIKAARADARAIAQEYGIPCEAA